MRRGNGDVILGNRDILQMYRHLDSCPSFYVFISRFKPHWSSYTTSSRSAFHFFSSSFYFVSFLSTWFPQIKIID